MTIGSNDIIIIVIVPTIRTIIFATESFPILFWHYLTTNDTFFILPKFFVSEFIATIAFDVIKVFFKCCHISTY